MCRRSDTLRENRRYEPIFDEKGFPRGKTQNETSKAVEVSVFVPWGALSTLSTTLKYPSPKASDIFYAIYLKAFLPLRLQAVF